MIDLYCERLSPGLLAEPLNASTNVAFLIAAWCCWKLASKESDTGLLIHLLVVLVAIIGVGSGLFHTFANGWSQLADVIPIMLFQLCFLAIYCRQVLALRWITLVGALLAFVAAGVLMGQFKHFLNGSVVYLPAFAAMLVLGICHYRLGLRNPTIVLWAALLFLVSLSFRSLDLWICSDFEMGTHFLWHLCNGWLLYLLMKGLIQSDGRRTESPTAG
ncbi:MAG: ceramidase domain-containing protein [Motiliproteus sp.]